ncbi:hypothetical protein [Chitinimonas naiadis]
MLTVQMIEILWTKATRGAPQANERVALVRAFPFDSSPAKYLTQRYRLAEWEDFQPQLISTETKQFIPHSEQELRIAAAPDGAFSLGIAGTPNSGQPKRYPKPKALCLMQGEFARLVVNARHTTYSGQYYSETIFNVTCGDQRQPDRFLCSQPDHFLDLREHLF